MPDPVMTTDELNAYMPEIFPQFRVKYPDLMVRSIADGCVIMDMTTGERDLRPGDTVSGPTLFALADLGGYACALAHIGRQPLAVTTSLNINFMRRAQAGRLEARCNVLKLGRSLMVFDCAIHAGTDEAMVAHATGTYALPPQA